MASFLERLRGPMLIGRGVGSEHAGEEDELDRAASLANLDRLLGGRLSGGGGGRRISPMRGGGGQGPGPKYNPYGRAMGPEGPMNVVYDQRPEQFNKELELRGKDLDVRRETNAIMNAIRQQNADTARERAETYDYGIKNPLGQVIQPRGGNATVIDRRTGRAMDTGVATGTMTEDAKLAAQAEAALNKVGAQGDNSIRLEQERQGGRVDLGKLAAESRLAAINAQGKNAADRQNDAQAFTAGRPREHAAALNNKAREIALADPEAAAVISFDPQGNFVIDPNASEELKARLNARLYGPSARSINQGKGSDASGLNTQPGQVSNVQMITPDGRTISVPSNRVGEAESRGARRK